MAKLLEMLSHLDLLSKIAGVLGFVWLGFTGGWSAIKKEGKVIWTGQDRSWLAWFSLLRGVAPVAVFGIAGVTLLYLDATRIEVRYHKVKWMKVAPDPSDSKDVPPGQNGASPASVVQISQDHELTFPASMKHCYIRICGAIYGPELQDIFDRYGETTRVYAVVEDGPPGQRTMWLQKENFGVLDKSGEYEVGAYLGGIGYESAKDGDHFSVRIYVPLNQKYVFPKHAVYDSEHPLPPALYLSGEVSVKCGRGPSHP